MRPGGEVVGALTSAEVYTDQVLGVDGGLATIRARGPSS
jgi:hypothetical protein